MKSPFDVVNDLCTKKYDPESYPSNSWMVDVILSQDEKLISIVEQVARLNNVHPTLRYDFYYNMIPNGKRFIKYFLSKKEKDTSNDDIIQEICDELKVNKSRAKEYLTILKSKGTYK